MQTKIPVRNVPLTNDGAKKITITMAAKKKVAKKPAAKKKAAAKKKR